MLPILRNTFSIILCCFLGFAIGIAQELESDGLPSLKDKKVLLVYGGWDGHQPKVFAEKFTEWLEKEHVTLTVSNSLDSYTDAKLMSETDLILQFWTFGEISKEQEKGLLEAIKNGAGLAGCHGGLGDSFRKNPGYQYMVGGQWTAHPGGKIDYKIDIIDNEDPITKGLTDFEIKETEQYYMLVDPNSKVLATTTFVTDSDSWIKGAVMPVAWKKHFGKGRVFYLSIGHFPKDFDTPSAWELMSRGVRWASGSKYQEAEHTVNPIYPTNTAIK